jgi:hypothetical protein
VESIFAENSSLFRFQIKKFCSCRKSDLFKTGVNTFCANSTVLERERRGTREGCEKTKEHSFYDPTLLSQKIHIKSNLIKFFLYIWDKKTPENQLVDFYYLCSSSGRSSMRASNSLHGQLSIASLPASAKDRIGLSLYQPVLQYSVGVGGREGGCSEDFL